jgi:hypothetical protein
VEPPLEEPPEGDWFCRTCLLTLNGPPALADGLFKPLMDTVATMNPTSFVLPEWVRYTEEASRLGTDQHGYGRRRGGRKRRRRGGHGSERRAAGGLNDVQQLRLSTTELAEEGNSDREWGVLESDDDEPPAGAAGVLGRGPALHMGYCFACGEGGEKRLMCELCPRTFHTVCLNRPPRNADGTAKTPSDRWVCPAHSDADVFSARLRGHLRKRQRLGAYFYGAAAGDTFTQDALRLDFGRYGESEEAKLASAVAVGRAAGAAAAAATAGAAKAPPPEGATTRTDYIRSDSTPSASVSVGGVLAYPHAASLVPSVSEQRAWLASLQRLHADAAEAARERVLDEEALRGALAGRPLQAQMVALMKSQLALVREAMPAVGGTPAHVSPEAVFAPSAVAEHLSPLFMQFLAWQRLMQITRELDARAHQMTVNTPAVPTASQPAPTPRDLLTPEQILDTVEGRVIASLVCGAKTWPLRRAVVSIGRGGGEAVDVDLDAFAGAKGVSRRHAVVFYDARSDQFFLSSYGRNGTFVNGLAVTARRAALPHEAIIQMGNV